MPEPTDHQTAFARRLEELTALYERRAYLTYNVAARVAGAGDAALRAASRAVLAQVAELDEDRLALDAARFGVEEAQAADPRAIASPVLSANARLTPPERAALALEALAEADAAASGEALGLDASAAADLLARAHTNLATLLRVHQPEAARAYRELPWAEPPAELWQSVYPELHAAVSARTRADGAEPLTRARGSRLRRTRSLVSLGPLRRLPTWSAVALVLLLAAGIALAARGGSDDARDDGAVVETGEAPGSLGSSGSDSLAGDGGGVYEALTPEELDKLRRQELEDLQRYSKKQTDKRLSQGERDDAEEKADDILERAKRRERAAAKREQLAQRQLARERAARVRERQAAEERERRARPNPTAPAPPPDDEPPDTRDGDPPPRQEPEQTTAECLYDTQSGTYICPQ